MKVPLREGIWCLRCALICGPACRLETQAQKASGHLELIKLFSSSSPRPFVSETLKRTCLISPSALGHPPEGLSAFMTHTAVSREEQILI